MAAVINTSDDLLKLLAENAEFYQAVRRLILTDELIELPEKFAKFADRVETFITRQEKFNEEQRQLNRRFETFIAEQRQFNEEQRQFNHRVEISIGELKGNTARYVVGVLFSEIAAHLGFTFKDTLMRRDLNTLIGPQGHTDVSSGDRQSFIRADLVVVTTDANGDTHYVAVEASYTADERDTRRARRNAELLQRLTGCPAHAVIASVHNVDSVQAEVRRHHPLVRARPEGLHTGVATPIREESKRRFRNLPASPSPRPSPARGEGETTRCTEVIAVFA